MLKWSTLPVRVWARFFAGFVLIGALSACGGGSVTAPQLQSGGRPITAAAPTSAPGPTATAVPTATPAPTATPVPTPTATPAISSAIAFSPTNITLTPQGSACKDYSGSFTASETGYTGAFTAVSSNASEFTVAPGPGANQFTVTSTATFPAAGGGGLYIYVSDSIGHTSQEPVVAAICLP